MYSSKLRVGVCYEGSEDLSLFKDEADGNCTQKLIYICSVTLEIKHRI